MPQLLATENWLLLAYLSVRPVAPDWDGRTVRIISPDTGHLDVTIVDFRRPYAHLFGPPNDEAFGGHPLADRGLHPYAAFEVGNSSWVRRLERMNAVHPYHDPTRFIAGRRHFVFAFHDTTFECVAAEINWATVAGSMQSVWDRMVAGLKTPPRLFS